MRILSLTIFTIALFSPSLLAQTITKNIDQKNKTWRQKVSASYLSFFDGPGLGPGQGDYTPNALGKPSEDGLALTNNLSFRYQLKDDFNLDLQLRGEWVTNNAKHVDNFQALRWQSPRFGISTTYFQTKNSKLSGAFNTDLPYFLPEPIGGGYIAERRTTILTPGLFAKYTYQPYMSRFSVMSLVMPRFFIYQNRHKAEPQLSRAGYAPELKNEFFVTLSPTLNYAFTDKFGARLGSEFVYKKLILSDWDPFNASTNSADINSKAWRLAPIPLQTGFTYEFHKMFSVSSYIQGYPIKSQRVNRKGESVIFEKTLSVGAWISGALF